MYNSDVFSKRKCVHIKLQTRFVESFRAELLKRRLSMQEAFDEFAGLVSQGDAVTLKLLDRIVYNKNREKMSKLLGSDVKPTKIQDRVLQTSTEAPVEPHDANTFMEMLERANPLHGDGRHKGRRKKRTDEDA
jgi:hypothetical protein